MTEAQFIQVLRNRFGAAKKSNKGWIQIVCPTCAPHDALKMKRAVHPKYEITKCFICEVPITYEHLMSGVNFDRVEGAIEEPTEHPQAKEYPFTKVIPINELNPSHHAIQLLTKDHLFDLDRYWEEYRVGYIASHYGIDIIFPKPDRAPTRLNTGDSIVFPVYFDNSLVGWQIRRLGNVGKLRYLQVYPKGKYLYNYDNARKHDSVVVVEGIKKALKFRNAVATLGKGITEEQIQLVQRWKRIAFMYDAEEVTQTKTQEIVKAINAGPRTCININPGDYGFPSPDEMTEEQCRKVVEESWTNLV